LDKVASIREEYTLSQLNRSDLKDNPFEQFESWLNIAYKAGVKEPNAMSIATVNNNGQPSSRMVLLRGFSENGFVFYTNYLSNKGNALADNNKVAILFFWDVIQQQIRIEGDCEKVAANQSDEYFDSRPFKSRVASSVSPQSTVVESRKILEEEFDAALEKATTENKIERPGHWGGYLVKPNLFEFWQGRKSRLHDRFQYTLNTENTQTNNNNWLIERLAP